MTEEPIADVDVPPVVGEDEQLSDEEIKVRNWRIRELDRMGVELPIAIAAAKIRSFNIHEVFKLVEKGCDPNVAVRIVTPIEAPIEA